MAWFRLVAVSTSQAITHSIRVEVKSRYSPEHSDPRKQQWFFLYTISIVNEGTSAVQLLNRHWIIMDATGNTEEVRGPGVVGEQPMLRPGERFEYTSGCPLKTPFGSMRGEYEMVTSSGEHFLATIAPFTLRRPGTVN